MNPEPRPIPLSHRVAHALPDAVTAGIFLYAWLAPFAWRKTLVAELMLIMLVEFVLVHAAPFLGTIALAPNLTFRKRVKSFVAFAFMYSVFIVAWSVSFKSWWPAVGFVWLVAAKSTTILVCDRQSVRDRQRMVGYWGASVGYYLLAVTATLFLPMPEFGITQYGSAYGIPGSGEWVSRPHIVIAAGFLYFSLLCITKLVEQPTWWLKLDTKSLRMQGSLFRS